MAFMLFFSHSYCEEAEYKNFATCSRHKRKDLHQDLKNADEISMLCLLNKLFSSSQNVSPQIFDLKMKLLLLIKKKDDSFSVLIDTRINKNIPCIGVVSVE